VVGPSVKDIRQRARRHGRDPREILISSLMTVIPGRTDKEAQDKYAEYKSYISHEGALTLFSGWTGVDFARFDLDDPIAYIKNDAINSAVDAFTIADPDKVWTVREIAEFVGIGGMGAIVVGSPKSVADQLQSWVEETDVDGFNLAYAVTPESFADFTELIVPELQRRGVFKREYQPGTLREKLYGPGRARLPDSHPAAAFRHNQALYQPHQRSVNG
jgi:alkanesulfonate monooxygenase